MSKQTQALLSSWGRSFFAAVVTAIMVQINAGGTFDVKAIGIAGLVAVLPVIQRYLNSNDEEFGRGAK